MLPPDERLGVAGTGISGVDGTGKAASGCRLAARARRSLQLMHRLILAVVTVAAFAVPSGAHAVSAGCTTAGVNQNTGPLSCEYRATGPGAYVAATGWPYQIAASGDRGASWRILVEEPRFGYPSSGELRTAAGDLVRISIGCWNDGRSCLGYCPPGPLHAVNCYYEGSRAGAVTAVNR